MKSPLLIAAMLVAAVLTATFVAPFFIDWNAYRSQLEHQISRFTGREATISGAITVRLLPAPRFELEDVRIANPAGAAEPDFLTARRISARLSLAPLLSRRIVVSSIRLVAPVFEAEILASGERSWRLGAAGTIVNLRDISLADTVIEDGVLRVRDARTGLLANITGIHGVLSAASLSGPARFTGHAVANGIGGEISVDLARAQDDGMQRGSLRLQPDEPDHPRLNIDVAFAGQGGGWSYTGNLLLERGARPDNGAGTGDGGVASHDPFRLSGRFSGDRAALAFEDLRLDAGGLAPSLKLTARFKFALHKVLGMEADIAVDWVDLDRLAKAPRAGDVIVDALGFANAALRRGLQGNVKLAVAAGNWRGARIGDVDYTARFARGSMTVARAAARLPGGVTAIVTGQYGAGTLLNPQSRFTGTFAQSGRDLRKFLRWALPGSRSALNFEKWRAGQEFAASGAVNFDGARLAVSKVKMRAGAAQGQGSLTIAARAPHEISIKAALSGVDGALVGIPPAVSGDLKGGWKRLGRFADQMAAGFGPTTISLDMTQSNIAGVVVARLGLDAGISRGNVKLSRARLTLGDGARIALHGEISEVTTTPAGFLEVEVEATDRGALDQLMRAGAGRLAGPAISVALERAATLNLTGSVKFSGPVNNRVVSGSARGAFGRGTLTAGLEFTGDPAAPRAGDLKAEFDLRNKDARDLIALSGLNVGKRPGDPLMPGALRLSFAGKPGGPLKIDGTATAMGLRATLSGGVIDNGADPRFKASLAFDAGDGRAALDALGLMPRGGNGGIPTRIKLTARIAGSTEKLAVNDLSGTVGAAHLTASGTIRLAGAVPRVRGQVDIDHASLPVLYGLLGDRNNTTAFDLRKLSVVDFELTGKVARFDLGGHLRVADASYALSQRGGVLTLRELKGQSAGGAFKLSGSARELSGALALKGEASLVGGRLERLLTAKSGAAPLRGRISLKAKMQTQAHTRPGLPATLAGSVSVKLNDGVLAGFDPRALADELATAPDKESQLRVLAALPDAGEFLFHPVSFKMSMANGELRAGILELIGDGATARVRTLYDLSAGKIDSEWRFTLFALANNPPLKVVVAGPLEAVRQTFDTRDLRDWVTVESLRRRLDELNRQQSGTTTRDRGDATFARPPGAAD